MEYVSRDDSVVRLTCYEDFGNNVGVKVEHVLQFRDSFVHVASCPPAERFGICDKFRGDGCCVLVVCFRECHAAGYCKDPMVESKDGGFRLDRDVVSVFAEDIKLVDLRGHRSRVVVVLDDFNCLARALGVSGNRSERQIVKDLFGVAAFVVCFDEPVSVGAINVARCLNPNVRVFCPPRAVGESKTLASPEELLRSARFTSFRSALERVAAGFKANESVVVLCDHAVNRGCGALRVIRCLNRLGVSAFAHNFSDPDTHRWVACTGAVVVAFLEGETDVAVEDVVRVARDAAEVVVHFAANKPSVVSRAVVVAGIEEGAVGSHLRAWDAGRGRFVATPCVELVAHVEAVVGRIDPVGCAERLFVDAGFRVVYEATDSRGWWSLERQSFGRRPTEALCRTILCEITGLAFEKRRPDWLDGLELDGFCPKLGLGFEFQGEQHYFVVPVFHPNGLEGLRDQQARDRKKLELCAKAGVQVIVVPFFVVDAEKFIKAKFERIKESLQPFKAELEFEASVSEAPTTLAFGFSSDCVLRCCVVCHRPGCSRRCEGCFLRYYCGPICQSIDSLTHRFGCDVDRDLKTACAYFRFQVLSHSRTKTLAPKDRGLAFHTATRERRRESAYRKAARFISSARPGKPGFSEQKFLMGLLGDVPDTPSVATWFSADNAFRAYLLRRFLALGSSESEAFMCVLDCICNDNSLGPKSLRFHEGKDFEQFRTLVACDFDTDHAMLKVCVGYGCLIAFGFEGLDDRWCVAQDTILTNTFKFQSFFAAVQRFCSFFGIRQQGAAFTITKSGDGNHRKQVHYMIGVANQFLKVIGFQVCSDVERKVRGKRFYDYFITRIWDHEFDASVLNLACTGEARAPGPAAVGEQIARLESIINCQLGDGS
ncbi:MAG: zinc finger MYND domain-containing protein [Patescibacteria group bacterium]|nr:zinc finger MYND domain-containing protein [Patescibacteria group bacterium]